MDHFMRLPLKKNEACCARCIIKFINSSKQRGTVSSGYQPVSYFDGKLSFGNWCCTIIVQRRNIRTRLSERLYITKIPSLSARRKGLAFVGNEILPYLHIKYVTRPIVKLFATLLIYFASYCHGTAVYSVDDFSQHVQEIQIFLWVCISEK